MVSEAAVLTEEAGHSAWRLGRGRESTQGWFGVRTQALTAPYPPNDKRPISTQAFSEMCRAARPHAPVDCSDKGGEWAGRAIGAGPGSGETDHQKSPAATETGSGREDTTPRSRSNRRRECCRQSSPEDRRVFVAENCLGPIACAWANRYLELN
jgi:hypothetical protein